MLTLKKIPRREALQFTIDRKSKPVLSVEVGESFLIETEDAYAGLIRTPDKLPIPEHVPNMRPGSLWGNPVAGPVFIQGLRKGDVLGIRIEQIEVDTQGVTCIEPGLGPLNESKRWPECKGPRTQIINHVPGPSGTTRDGRGVLGKRFIWDLQPFIGTIALAPDSQVNTVTDQGPWGGNLDCRDIREGSTLYLNSYNDGGLLYVGDVHASQGDTEFYGIADETRANVVLSCHIIKEAHISNPRVEKKDSIIALCSAASSLEEAVRTAMLDLMEWMVSEYHVSPVDAYTQLTVNPDLRVHVYQMCRVPEKLMCTAGAEIPKKYLRV